MREEGTVLFGDEKACCVDWLPLSSQAGAMTELRSVLIGTSALSLALVVALFLTIVRPLGEALIWPHAIACCGSSFWALASSAFTPSRSSSRDSISGFPSS